MLAGRFSFSDITFLAKIMAFDNGFVEVLSCDRSVFRQPGWEAKDGPKQRRRRDPAAPPDTLRSVRRAKARVRQIAMANDFDYFVTLTLDGGKVDRYDDRTVIRKLCNWCENQVKRYDLRYVVIPERHKDGALHFHGFMSWDGGEVAVESGTYTMNGWKKPRMAVCQAQADSWLADGAKPVYNLPRWTLGFSTAIAVYGEYGAAVGYVCKYVGKQMDNGKIGGRWYYSGGKLRKPKVGYFNLSHEDMAALPNCYDFRVNAAGNMRLWRGKAEDLAAVLGPVLEKTAFDDFWDRFYSEDDENTVSRETFFDFPGLPDLVELDMNEKVPFPDF